MHQAVCQRRESTAGRNLALSVLIINLARRPDRREHMARELAKFGWVATYLDAVDCMHPAFGERHGSAMTASGLRPGELACYLSHVEAWRRIAVGPDDVVLLLEDDVVLDAGLPSVLQDMLPYMHAFDLLRLSALRKQVGLRVQTLPGSHQLLIPTKHVSGTQGYLISKAGAALLLSRIAVPLQPIDTVLDRYWMWHGVVGMVRPALISEINGAGSDIASMGRTNTSRSHAIARRLAFSVRKWLGIWRALILAWWRMHGR